MPPWYQLVGNIVLTVYILAIFIGKHRTKGMD